MRFVFGLVAMIVLCAGWMVCPVSARDHLTRSVTPDAETVEEMRAGVEVIAAALSVQSPDLDEHDENGR
ncbi:MAG: hypothetical protein HLUCCA04_04920 [Oceanicaulis sp. HLUCCA04]|nr:MAG: hypothetical protein HLUCCA04_04920 [Oceanicaulis sp. HLUCCA04]